MSTLHAIYSLLKTSMKQLGWRGRKAVERKAWRRLRRWKTTGKKLEQWRGRNIEGAGEMREWKPSVGGKLAVAV